MLVPQARTSRPTQRIELKSDPVPEISGRPRHDTYPTTNHTHAERNLPQGQAAVGPAARQEQVAIAGLHQPSRVLAAALLPPASPKRPASYPYLHLCAARSTERVRSTRYRSPCIRKVPPHLLRHLEPDGCPHPTEPSSNPTRRLGRDEATYLQRGAFDHTAPPAPPRSMAGSAGTDPVRPLSAPAR